MQSLVCRLSPCACVPWLDEVDSRSSDGPMDACSNITGEPKMEMDVAHDPRCVPTDERKFEEGANAVESDVS